MTPPRDRKTLIRTLWPDKILYGATLLLVTALLGVVHGGALTFGDITFSEEVPALLRGYPPEFTLTFSVLAAALAGWALRDRDVRVGVAGAIAGILSLGLLGLGSLLSLLALGAMYLGYREGEDMSPATQELHARMWPDKALAASVLLLVTGALTIWWGLALASEAVVFAGYMGDVTTFGMLSVAAGLLCILAAYMLYLQRGRLVGLLACLAGILALALWVVGPLLSLAALALIWQAGREGEFDASSPSQGEEAGV